MDENPTSSSSFQKQVMEQPTRNWLELPSDVMANILFRIGVHDILENGQKVCTTWWKICKDPAIWREIYIDNFSLPDPPDNQLDIRKVTAVCKHAVHKSQGQLIDITMVWFCSDELLLYIADRSSQLRRLKIEWCYVELHGSWTKALKKFPLLEELNLYSAQLSKEAIEIAGRYCPMLKTLKLNQDGRRFWDGDTNENHNEIAIAIGENLHELEHLELIGNSLSNIGLQVILDGCHHLKSLDLSQCLYIDTKGDLGKRCSEQIKCLKLPKIHTYGFNIVYLESFDDLSD